MLNIRLYAYPQRHSTYNHHAIRSQNSETRMSKITDLYTLLQQYINIIIIICTHEVHWKSRRAVSVPHRSQSVKQQETLMT